MRIFVDGFFLRMDIGCKIYWVGVCKIVGVVVVLISLGGIYVVVGN